MYIQNSSTNLSQKIEEIEDEMNRLVMARQQNTPRFRQLSQMKFNLESDDIANYLANYQSKPGDDQGTYSDLELAERDSAPLAPAETPQYKQKTIAELEAEIVEAISSKNPQKALAELVLANRLPLSVIERYSQHLVRERNLKIDLERRAYEECMHRFREIELKEDPGERVWKIQALAREFHRTEKQIRESYFKSLIAQKLEEPMTREEMRKKHGGGRHWLMRGWIPKQSLILLHAQGGVGKTLYVNHLVRCLASGTDWEEYRVENPVPILYIQTDTPPGIMDNYLEQADIQDDLPIRYHINWQIEHTYQLYKWIKKYGSKFIVIDCLTSINQNTMISENDVEYSRPLLQLRDISKELDCTFLIIHHSNAEGGARGTRSLRNTVDELQSLTPVNPQDPTNPERILNWEKSRSRITMKYRMEFTDDDYSWRLLEMNEDEPTNRSTRWTIQEHFLKNKGVRFVIDELVNILQLNESTLRKELRQMVKEGMIDRQANPSFKVGASIPRHFYLINEEKS
jgi:hypothetical protein